MRVHRSRVGVGACASTTAGSFHLLRPGREIFFFPEIWLSPTSCRYSSAEVFVGIWRRIMRRPRRRRQRGGGGGASRGIERLARVHGSPRRVAAASVSSVSSRSRGALAGSCRASNDKVGFTKPMETVWLLCLPLGTRKFKPL